MHRLQRTPSPKATTSGRNRPPMDATAIPRLFRFKICCLLSPSKCRFAKYFKAENGTEFRRLHKAYAIRFDVMVTGNVSCEKLLRLVNLCWHFQILFLEGMWGVGLLSRSYLKFYLWYLMWELALVVLHRKQILQGLTNHPQALNLAHHKTDELALNLITI